MKKNERKKTMREQSAKLVKVICELTKNGEYTWDFFDDATFPGGNTPEHLEEHPEKTHAGTYSTRKEEFICSVSCYTNKIRDKNQKTKNFADYIITIQDQNHSTVIKGGGSLWNLLSKNFEELSSLNYFVEKLTRHSPQRETQEDQPSL